MDFEENILRVLTVEESAYMPELTEFNPVGIMEVQARDIARRNNLRITRGKLSTGDTLFKFRR